jgi:hypothetical protein
VHNNYIHHVAFNEGDNKGLDLGSCTSLVFQLITVVLYTVTCVDFSIRFSCYKRFAHIGQFEFERSTQKKHNANNDHSKRVITSTILAQSDWELQVIETKWRRKRLWCKVGHSSFLTVAAIQYTMLSVDRGCGWRQNVLLLYHIAWYSNMLNQCVRDIVKEKSNLVI